MKMRYYYTLYLGFSFLISACSTTEKTQNDYSRTFNVPYETVWRATQQAMLNYPMNINNMDTGTLQTLYITGKHRYQAPHLEQDFLPSGYQYRININLVQGEKATRVVISKEVRLQKDFFSEPVDMISDGFEEKSLVYRIRREIQIENLLRKMMEKKQKPQALLNFRDSDTDRVLSNG